MKNSRRTFFKQGLAGALALGSASLPVSAAAMTDGVGKAKAKRVVLISLDGICVEGFLKARTLNLEALLADGSLSLDTRVVMPSVTLPNWTSHLTGSGPEQHGVVDNSWEISKFKLPAIHTDSDGYYPSVFKILKDAVPQMKTAFYYNWINLFYPYNKKYLDEVSYLEQDAYVPNYEKAFSFLMQTSRSQRSTAHAAETVPCIPIMPGININGCLRNISSLLKKRMSRSGNFLKR